MTPGRVAVAGLPDAEPPLLAALKDKHAEVRLACAYTGREKSIACETLILCTGRLPSDDLYQSLQGQLPSLTRVGDCLQPSSIADAVYSGHRFARLLGEQDLPPRRELPSHRATS